MRAVRLPLRSCLAATLLGGVLAHPGSAQLSIPASQANAGFTTAIMARVDSMHSEGVFDKPYSAKVMRYRVVGVRINGTKPMPRIFWVEDGATPYWSCGPGNLMVNETITDTDRSELTMSKTESHTATVDVSIGASYGVVEGSVAAGYAYSVETGRSETRGKEHSISKGYETTLSPNTGVWVSPTTARFVYSNAEYEMDVEIVEARVQGRFKGMLGSSTQIWKDFDFSKKPILAKVVGHFTGSIPTGKFGIAEMQMTADEVAGVCQQGPFGGGTGTTRGVAAGRRPGNTGPQRRLPIKAGTEVPANIKVLP